MTHTVKLHNVKFPTAYDEATLDEFESLPFTYEGFEFAAIYDAQKTRHWHLWVKLAGTSRKLHNLTSCGSRCQAVEYAATWMSYDEWGHHRGFLTRIFELEGDWFGEGLSFDGQHYVSSCEVDEQDATERLIEQVDAIAQPLEESYVDNAKIRNPDTSEPDRTVDQILKIVKIKAENGGYSFSINLPEAPGAGKLSNWEIYGTEDEAREGAVDFYYQLFQLYDHNDKLQGMLDEGLIDIDDYWVRMG